MKAACTIALSRTISSVVNVTLLLLILLVGLHDAFAFTPVSPNSISRCSHVESTRVILNLSGKKEEGEGSTSQPAVDALSKTSWYVVEAFGNIFGSGGGEGDDKAKTTDASSYSLEDPPRSVQETLKRIQEDFTRSYFLSGDVDALIYDEQCIFSDPFVSFEGRDRFITNLANLGSFVTKFSVRPLEFDAEDPLAVKTKVMVKLELGLPWKPVLAWPWGVEYKIDSDSFLITEHKETWDIEPIEGVKQIFRKPTTKVE